ncbi:hypothetical protein [Pseudonocardia sp.]|uniref:hypothetical protein n=1 Tax=Pseudonocardia sp. TaxID=60912 RepID=UPI002609B3FF|nr:hypothetical protein [Pseudonocardia sp.]
MPHARPGWLDARRLARPLGGHVNALHSELCDAGARRTVAVTAGAVGYNAAALVPGEPRLTVLDTPDAARVADVLAGDLEATALVVAVPPGVDRRGIDAVTAAVQRALRADGIDPRSRTVAVVPPGQPAPDALTVIEGPPDVHDVWTAFTPYSLVPGGIAGADVRMLLGNAEQSYDADDPANHALVLGALLAAAESVTITDTLGVEDVLVELIRTLARSGGGLRRAGDRLTIDVDDGEADVRIGGNPTGRLHLFQRAVAVAGYLRGTDPTAPEEPPTEVPPLAFRDGDVDVHAAGLPAGVTTVAGALAALLDSRPGPVALHAHLDRESDASAAVLRGELARRARRPVTFTWAPGRPPPGGLAVQLVGDVLQDGPAPPGPGPDGLRLHLRDRLTGLVTLARAVQEL